MNREDTQDDILIDLGAASVETKGPPLQLDDSEGGISNGLTDD